MKKIIVLMFVITQYLFATISITPVEIASNSGLHGAISTSLETKRGNTNQDRYKGALRVVYDNNRTYITWAEISGEIKKSDGVEKTNKSFIHYRYIHKIDEENLRWELFAQVQDDKFRLIKRRLLGGLGGRVKLLDNSTYGKSYFGIGGFYETIKYTSNNDSFEKNLRINTYFTYSKSLTEESSLNYSFYYQPKLDSFNDYSQVHKIALNLNVYKAIFLSFKLSYDVDSKPAIDVKTYDFYQETSLGMKF